LQQLVERQHTVMLDTVLHLTGYVSPSIPIGLPHGTIMVVMMESLPVTIRG
jgi:hypothetical protein